MPFKKGHKVTNLQEDKFYMSVGAIAKELNTTEADIVCVIYSAMQKIKRPRYKYLEEYQNVEIDPPRISTPRIT